LRKIKIWSGCDFLRVGQPGSAIAAFEFLAIGLTEKSNAFGGQINSLFVIAACFRVEPDQGVVTRDVFEVLFILQRQEHAAGVVAHDQE